MAYPRFEIKQVAFKGGSWSFQAGVPHITVKCSAPLSSALADKMGFADHVYVQDGQRRALRKFKSHTFGWGFEDATLIMSPTDNKEQPPIEIKLCNLKGWEVVQKEEGVGELVFRVRVALTCYEMTDYVNNMGTDPSYKFVIVGRQKELQFGSSDDGDDEGAQQELPGTNGESEEADEKE